MLFVLARHRSGARREGRRRLHGGLEVRWCVGQTGTAGVNPSTHTSSQHSAPFNRPGKPYLLDSVSNHQPP